MAEPQLLPASRELLCLGLSRDSARYIGTCFALEKVMRVSHG